MIPGTSGKDDESMNNSPFQALHIGDLHFWSIPFNPLRMLNKRILGLGNLLIGGRARRFKLSYAPQLAQRLADLTPDAILFSGDFSTTALAAEFRAAAKVFNAALAHSDAEVYSVPGNHDCYIRRELGAATFARSLGERFNPECGHSLRYFAGGEIALFRINASASNRFGSHGHIVDGHIEFMKEKLGKACSRAKHIWFMCHFPAEDPPGVLKHDRGIQLRGAERLLALFAECSIPILWLHGHHHYRWVYGSPSVEGLTYLNAGAPLLRRVLPAPDLGFHQIHYEHGSLTITTHRFHHKEWQTKEVGLPGKGEYINLQDWDE